MRRYSPAGIGAIAVLSLLAMAAAATAATTNLAGSGQPSPLPVQQAQRGLPAPKVDCSCRYRGEKIPLGQTICLQMGNRARVATCRMTLNNTSWDITETDCAPISLMQPAKPPLFGFEPPSQSLQMTRAAMPLTANR